MYAQEEYVNATKGYRCGDSDVYETFTDDLKHLFRAFQRDYGRCTSKVYIENPDGSVRAIGWVFQKMEKYTDCNETYLQEVWITLHDDKPTKTTEYHYHTLCN